MATNGGLPAYDVVIPCHDRAGFVGQAVASILAQSHPPAQIVLIDDASTDDTASVIRALAAEHACVQALLLPRNGGVATARYAGIAAGASPWIAFLDDDDVWTPGAAAALLGRAAAGDADIVVGYFARIEAGGVPGPPECGWAGDDIRAALRTGGVVGTSWSLVRRATVYSANGFDPTYRTCEDWAFFTAAAAGGARFARIDECVAHYRTVPGQRMIADTSQLSADGARVLAHPFLMRP